MNQRTSNGHQFEQGPFPAQAPFSGETKRAREAQLVWAQVPLPERLQRVRAFRRGLVDAQDRICNTIACEVGKSAVEIIFSDILPLAEQCRFLETNARRILRPRRSSLRSTPVYYWGQRDVTYRFPRGVVAVIGTWNLPLMICGMQIMHAFVAGNAVVFKPSEVAPKSGELLADLIAQAGFPDGLLHLLPAHRDTGPQLAEADIDHVVLTGSTSTGRALASTLGRRLVSSTLELSGCDLLLLLDDGDVKLAARGAWFGATANAGQACVGTRRAYVPRSQLHNFLDFLTPLVERALPVALVLPDQVAIADDLVADALALGARLIRRDDLQVKDGYVQPAALVQESPDARACRESFFFPLLNVIPYDGIDQVLTWIAECPYRLSASVFTADPQRALALSERLRCGMVHVNDVIVPMGHPATPFGGQGASGWGRTKGHEGLLEMTAPQVVSVVRGRFRPHFDAIGSHWFLHAEALSGLLEIRHAATLRGKLRGARRLLRQIPSRRQRDPSS